MSDSSVLTATASGQTGAGTGARLVTQIARCVGGESEGEIRAQALDCLNRVRVELNQHDWKFMKRTDSPITLSDGTATYSLQAAFRKPSYAVMIDAAGEQQLVLDYVDDEVFAHDKPIRSPSGPTAWYSLRNDFEDGLVTLYPTPDISMATDFRLVVEYYARIGAYSDTNESDIEVPEEITNALVIGGQAYLMRDRGINTPMAAQAFQDYLRVKMLLLTSTRRLTEEQPRFRLKPNRTVPNWLWPRW